MTRNCPANCGTTQILDPNQDLLVDTAGTRSEVDERGTTLLIDGQTNVVVPFEVLKLSSDYNFEYLYIEAVGVENPGSITIVPTYKAIDAFAVSFAGAPIGTGYILHWRVTVVSVTAAIAVDSPEDQYIQLPRANLLAISFVNPRSSTTYGFSELRVENITDLPADQTPISVQVVAKSLSGFSIGISPTPPTDNYFLRMRTP